MYKKILVAVDGSETSYLALAEAIRLAKSMQAKLCMTLVVNEFSIHEHFPHGVDFIKYQKNLKDKAQCVLDKMNQYAKDNGATPEVKLVEICNEVKKIAEVIIETAQSWHADLIIIGTHGRHGFNRFLLGSVAEATIRLAPIPVLLIRAKA